MNMATLEFFTVQDAAEKIGISDGRVRKICIDHSIGKRVGTMRLLSDGDIERIRQYRGKVGRPKKDEDLG